MKSTKPLYRLTFALILLGFVITAILLAFMPARVPMHYNATGEADRIGSKYENLLFPCSTALYGALFLVLARYMGKKNAGSERPLLICTIVMCSWFDVLFTVLMLKPIRLSAGQAAEVDITKFTAIALGLILVVTGNIMPKATRNAVFGLRTTWSSKNDVVWQRCQRFGGYTGIAAGLLLVVLSCFLGGMAISAAMIAVLLLWTVVCIAGSKMIYLKWERGQNIAQ